MPVKEDPCGHDQGIDENPADDRGHPGKHIVAETHELREPAVLGVLREIDAAPNPHGDGDQGGDQGHDDGADDRVTDAATFEAGGRGQLGEELRAEQTTPLDEDVDQHQKQRNHRERREKGGNRIGDLVEAVALEGRVVVKGEPFGEVTGRWW
jgi:hypothetical protein